MMFLFDCKDTFFFLNGITFAVINFWLFLAFVKKSMSQIILTPMRHDRFLIIDNVVYLFGASLKDAGKKLFAYIKMQETPASELLNNIR